MYTSKQLYKNLHYIKMNNYDIAMYICLEHIRSDNIEGVLDIASLPGKLNVDPNTIEMYKGIMYPMSRHVYRYIGSETAVRAQEAVMLLCCLYMGDESIHKVIDEYVRLGYQCDWKMCIDVRHDVPHLHTMNEPEGNIILFKLYVQLGYDYENTTSPSYPVISLSDTIETSTTIVSSVGTRSDQYDRCISETRNKCEAFKIEYWNNDIVYNAIFNYMHTKYHAKGNLSTRGRTYVTMFASICACMSNKVIGHVFDYICTLGYTNVHVYAYGLIHKTGKHGSLLYVRRSNTYIRDLMKKSRLSTILYPELYSQLENRWGYHPFGYMSLSKLSDVRSLQYTRKYIRFYIRDYSCARVFLSGCKPYQRCNGQTAIQVFDHITKLKDVFYIVDEISRVIAEYIYNDPDNRLFVGCICATFVDRNLVDWDAVNMHINKADDDDDSVKRSRISVYSIILYYHSMGDLSTLDSYNSLRDSMRSNARSITLPEYNAVNNP